MLVVDWRKSVPLNASDLAETGWRRLSKHAVVETHAAVARATFELGVLLAERIGELR